MRIVNKTNFLYESFKGEVNMDIPKWKTLGIACFTLSMTISLIIFPEVSFNASVHGLHTWWEVVFPSLLPFFIMAELLIGFGIVQFIGVIFQPIMRPIFNVPGVGSFAWIVGMASGYPSGAKITALLRKNKEISKIEAERLISFTNASSPLFIFGAIAVGFFYDTSLGIFIAICHYASNFLVGIAMRFYKIDDEDSSQSKSVNNQGMTYAFQKMHDTRIKNTRPFGQIVGDAIISSVQTLLMIGGFIIFFSVFTTLLHELKLFEILHTILRPILHVFHVPSELIQPLSTGLFEISLGAEMVSSLDNVPLIIQLTVISFILGFNGLSVQAQVASIIANTDIRFHPYFFARILHATIASILTVILYPFFFQSTTKKTDLPTIALQDKSVYSILDFIFSHGPIFTLVMIFLALCILLNRVIKANNK